MALMSDSAFGREPALLSGSMLRRCCSWKGHRYATNATILSVYVWASLPIPFSAASHSYGKDLDYTVYLDSHDVMFYCVMWCWTKELNLRELKIQAKILKKDHKQSQNWYLCNVLLLSCFPSLIMQQIYLGIVNWTLFTTVEMLYSLTGS